MGVIYFLIVAEKESNEFRNYEEVEESGLINRGWIPQFIPESAYNIIEKHRVDVPHIDVEFAFDTNDIGSFETACEKVHEDVFVCPNSGYPVEVLITNDNYATIHSVQNGS